LPDDRIAQLARIARVDAGEWLVAIHADQASGDARKGLQLEMRRARPTRVLRFASWWPTFAWSVLDPIDLELEDLEGKRRPNRPSA
jgi:hypothetical protein